MQKISIPKRDGKQCPFAFVTFKHKLSVEYALSLFDGTKLFNRVLTLKERNGNKQQQQQGNSRMEQMPNQLNPFQNIFQQLSSQVLMGQMGYNYNLPPNMLMYPPQMNNQARYSQMNSQVNEYYINCLIVK